MFATHSFALEQAQHNLLVLVQDETTFASAQGPNENGLYAGVVCHYVETILGPVSEPVVTLPFECRSAEAARHAARGILGLAAAADGACRRGIA